MKRDMDLCREILRRVEDSDPGLGWVEVEVQGHSSETIAGHVQLLDEAGLIDAHNVSADELAWKPQRLTWSGHEFLEAAREDDRWEKAKSLMMTKAGGISFVVLKELLLEQIRGQVF